MSGSNFLPELYSIFVWFVTIVNQLFFKMWKWSLVLWSKNFVLNWVFRNWHRREYPDTSLYLLSFRPRQNEGKFKAAKKRTFWCWIKEFWSNLFEMARSVIMMKVESKVWFCPGIPRGYSLSASPEDLKIFFFYFLESKATAQRYTPGTNHLPLKGLLSWLNCVDQVNHQKSIIVLCGCIRRNELIIIVWD